MPFRFPEILQSPKDPVSFHFPLYINTTFHLFIHMFQYLYSIAVTSSYKNSQVQFQSSMESTQELHVLAVDDSNIDRKVIEKLLKVSSFKVTVVDSGSRALEYLGLDDDTCCSTSPRKFDDLKVNLIMTDYSMPGMTGFELLKKIKNSSTLKEIPVVIMSSENILTRIDRCMEEGAEDYLLKPVKLSDVTRLKDSILKTGNIEKQSELRKRKRSDDRLPVLPSSLSCHKNVVVPAPASPPPKLC